MLISIKKIIVARKAELKPASKAFSRGSKIESEYSDALFPKRNNSLFSANFSLYYILIFKSEIINHKL